MAEDQITSWMTGFFSADIWTFIVATWWAWLLLIGAVVVWLIMRHKKKFPLRAVIWERRGDDVITHLDDRIGRIKADTIIKWKFMKSKDTIPPENYNYVSKCLKGAGVAHFIKYGAGQYKIVDVRELFKEEGKFRIIDTDDWNFKVLEFRATQDRRKEKLNFIQTYGPMIGLLIVCITIIATCAISYNMIRDVIATIPREKIATDASVTQTQVAEVPVISNLINS